MKGYTVKLSVGEYRVCGYRHMENKYCAYFQLFVQHLVHWQWLHLIIFGNYCWPIAFDVLWQIITETHTRLTALFRDYPREPVPER